MPNPVAANDLQPISGSLQTSRISYGVETAGKNYGQNYNGSNWYSDIPNNGQFYTIISDNYTANYYVSRSNAGGAYVEGGLPAVDEYSAPVFWVTVGTSSLDVITVVNGLPDRIGQTPFNSGSQALNWVASSSNYFAVGPDYYDQIDADQLQLYLDANQVISYPTTQSTWYDLSGYTKNGTLYNGPTFSAVSGAIIFDGTDDYVQGPIPNQNPAEATLEIWYNTTADEAFPGENRLLAIGVSSAIPGGASAPGISLRLRDDRVAFAARKADNSGYWDIYSGATVIDGRWKHVIGTFDTTALKRYENGVLTEQTATGQNYLTASDGYSIGGPYAFFDGKIAKARFYSKTLSAAEVLQNYYGGPIVTSDLVWAIDASNLVSYPRTGTTWYDLTTNAINGTLANGATFYPYEGGIISLDGTDDYVDFGTADFQTADSITIDMWVNPQSVTQNQYADIFDANHSGGGFVFQQDNLTHNYYYFAYYDGGGFQVTSNIFVDPYVWSHIVITKEGDQGRIYKNGQLVISNTFTNPSIQGSNRFLLGRYYGSSSRYWLGEYGSMKIYNRALTAAEVLQNYNATN